MKKIFPLTITDKIIECKDFYVKFFNFEVVFEAEWYIQLRNKEGIELAFMLPNQQNQPDFLQSGYAGGGVVYSFEVDNAQGEYEGLKAINAVFAYELKEEEWGQKHFMMKDPSGMVVDVVEHLG